MKLLRNLLEKTKPHFVEGEKIQLENCNKRERAFLLLAIAEYNASAHPDKQLETGEKNPTKLWGDKKSIKEWNEFQTKNPLKYDNQPYFTEESKPKSFIFF